MVKNIFREIVVTITVYNNVSLDHAINYLSYYFFIVKWCNKVYFVASLYKPKGKLYTISHADILKYRKQLSILLETINTQKENNPIC